MTAKHTAGPWTFRAVDFGLFEIVRDENQDDPVLRIRGGMTPRLADARLIAAAPDLLDALESFLHQVEYNGDGPAYEYHANIARAALAKARGR